MIQQIDFSRFSDAQTTAVSVDPIIEIGYVGPTLISGLLNLCLITILLYLFGDCSVLNISEFRFKLSMAMSPTQRPVGVLGFWSSLMTALGNTENMPVSIKLSK